MKLAIPIRAVLKPSVISMMAAAASLGAWLFPAFGVLRKGFDNPSRLSFAALVVLGCWYLLIFTSFFIGQNIVKLWFAGSKNKVVLSLLDLESNSIYVALTVIAVLGLGAMVTTIFRQMTFTQAFLFISLGQTNALKDTIYEDYHIGLVSLRYVVFYPASVAFYRIIRLKHYSPLNFFNVFLLALSAFLSSRLILIAGVVTTIYLVTFDRRIIRISITKLALVAGALFFVLSLLNLSRNAAFYERNKLSFGLAGVNEIVAYLGTPFQVAVGAVPVAGQLVAQGPGDPTHSSEPYRYYIDVGINYNTNSAFVALHQKMGYWCWPYIAALCGVMGAAFTLLASMGRTYFLLPCGAILYASSELWRLDLFEQGTFIVWFVVGVGLPLGVLAVNGLWRFADRLHRGWATR